MSKTSEKNDNNDSQQPFAFNFSSGESSNTSTNRKPFSALDFLRR